MSDALDPDHPLAQLLAEQQVKADAHTALRETVPYKAAMGRIDKLVLDYGLAINAIDLMATRWPPYFDRLITLRLKPQLVESTVAASYFLKEGLFNPARRELRFLVEASVKTLWLDSGCPPIDRTEAGERTPPLDRVEDKVAALDDLGAERFREIVGSLSFKMIDEPGAEAYRQAARSLYGSLSTVVHVSSGTIARDLRNFDRGRNFGFETVANVHAVADLIRQVLDLALASHLEAFDAALVGDIFTTLLDDMRHWTFHKTPLVGAVSRSFDYKAERQPGWKDP